MTEPRATDSRSRRARPAARARSAALRSLAIAVTLALAGGCVSGRILEGYPGHPFLAFEAPVDADSAFFALQEALGGEGFEIDFSERESGLINTRPVSAADGRMFLSAVVDTAAGGSRIWVAGYEPVRGGARRINPLDEAAWSELERIVARLSERLDGSEPEGPPPPD